MADVDHPSPRAPWLLVILWVALIYATVPMVRSLQEYFRARWDEGLIGWGVAMVVVATAVGAVAAIRRFGGTRPSPLRLLGVAAVAAIMLWWTYRLRAAPVEAVHLIEYGVLSVLAERALRSRIGDATVYFSAGLVGTLVGTVDEIIQWLTPGRFWDFRDIVLNGGACVLALIALWCLRPPCQERVSRASWRLLLRLAAAQLVLLTMCLANTPTTVHGYAAALPGLGFLADTDNAMAEYGHRHVFPTLGEFRSRFTLDELRGIDAERSAEAAAVIDRYRPNRYGRFLEDYPSGREPFIHELRVHIFNRNRNLAEARKEPEGSDPFRRRMTVALREQQILDHFFGETLRRSQAHRLGPRQLESMERHHIPDSYVTSKAGSHLITAISEGRLRLLLLAAIVALIALDRYLGPRKAR